MSDQRPIVYVRGTLHYDGLRIEQQGQDRTGVTPSYRVRIALSGSPTDTTGPGPHFARSNFTFGSASE